MASITPDGKNELVALYLIMFGRGPTSVQLVQMVTARESGSTLAQVATTLATEADFAHIASKDVDAFSIYLADALLAADTPPEARDWSINWTVTQLQGILTKAQVISEAVKAIRLTDNSMYLTAKAEIEADVENALQAINSGYTLTRAFEIGLENLPDNYLLSDGSLNLGTNTVAELILKIAKSETIVEASENSESIDPTYVYLLRDELENLSSQNLLIIGSSPYEISNTNIILGSDLKIEDFESDEISVKIKIINEASNNDLIQTVYTICDTLEIISNNKYKNILTGAQEYKISNSPGNLGLISLEQYEILKNAANFGDYTFIDLDDAASVNAILVGFGLTMSEAKKIILQYADNLDQIASALKQANLTAGEMAAILISSSGAEDPPIILSENKIKEHFENYVTDYQGLDAGSNIDGDSGNNLLIGTDAAEIFTGGDGIDSVIYDGEISRFELTRIYEGKSGSFSGYKVKDLNGSNAIDELNSDIEYIIFRDEKLKIPTSGILQYNTEVNGIITGTSDNDILLGDGDLDAFSGGDGIDTVLVRGNLVNYNLIKLYEGKNGSFSGYQLSNTVNINNVSKLSNDIEYIQFYDEKVELSTFSNEDDQVLSVNITSAKKQLKVGESTILNFKFSENVRNFTIDDIKITGGEISNLRGLGDTYQVLFKNSGQLSEATVELKSGSMTSSIGKSFISEGVEYIEMILDLNLYNYADDEVRFGGKGDDVFAVSSSGTIDGGDGFDQVWINKNLADYDINLLADFITLSEKNTSSNKRDLFIFNSIERVHFNDKSLAFDMDGNAGVAASVLFHIIGPEAVNLPLFVGVALGKLENSGLTPRQLAKVAAEFSLGFSVTDRDSYKALISKVADNLNVYWYDMFINTILPGYDFIDEIAKAPYDNNYATVGLLGIEYLEYTPQYI
jgi:hypothetical protein